MKQEDKDLLLQDLCCRLPYGVKVQTTYINQKSKERRDIGTDVLTTVELSMLIDGFEEHKPYLFPLSSMTEEQTKNFYSTIRPVVEDDLNEYSDYEEIEKSRPVTMKSIKVDVISVNWMLKNHFDINGLIPKNLAIDATNLNVY